MIYRIIPAQLAGLIILTVAQPALATETAPQSTQSTIALGTDQADLAQDCRKAYLNSNPDTCYLKSNAIIADPRLQMRVGASDLGEVLQGLSQGHAKFRLAQVLDGCQKMAGQENLPKFSCTLMVARIAALAYRDKGHNAEMVSDTGSTVTVAGLLGALIEYQQSASAVRWTSIVGVIPIVSEEALQMRARERLYLISAGAMNALSYRYYQYSSLAAQAGTANDLSNSVPAEGVALCDEINALATDVSQWQVKSDQLVVATQVTDLQTQCKTIVAADALLRTDFIALNSLQSDTDIAAALTIDTKNLDDEVALLDRELRSTPTQAFRQVLGAPFNLVGKILAGTAQPSGLSDTATALFVKPFTLPLSATPNLTAPTLPTAPLGMSALVGELVASTNKTLSEAQAATNSKTTKGKAAIKSAQSEADSVKAFQAKSAEYIAKINKWLLGLNQANAVLNQLQALANKPIMTIDFTANNQPVTFAKPPSAS